MGIYYSEFERYVNVSSTTNYVELENATIPLTPFDVSKDFTAEKNRLLIAIKNKMATFLHPTVWFELKKQRTKYDKLNLLFQKVPEPLTWTFNNS